MESKAVNLGYKSAAIDAPLAERLAFLRKVYGLLSITVFVAAAATWMTLGNMALLTFAAQNHFMLFILEIGAILFTMWARKKETLGLVALFTFTILTGVTISPLVYHLQDVVPEALALTGITFAGLSLYVTQTKKDFSFLGGMLTVGIIVMIVGGLLNMFLFQNSGMTFLFSVFGVFLFSGFILYDTSNILHNYPTDEYISATLSLYLDIFNLFIVILRLLGGNRD